MPKRSTDLAGPGGQEEPTRSISLRGRSSIGGLGLITAALIIGLIVVSRPAASPPGPGASSGPATPGPAATPAAPTPVASVDPTPIVSRPVQPRPGVPSDVAARSWLAESSGVWPGRDGGSTYVAGIAGTTARIILPPTEWGLAADGGRVASRVADGATTTIIVRDITTGQVLRTAPVSMVAERGLFVGGWLYVAGFADPGRTQDGGVQRLDLSSPGSTFETIINAGPFDAGVGEPAERGPVVASPSGRTIVSGVGGLRRGDADIIDATTGTVLRRLRNVLPVIANDVGIYALGDGQDRFVDLVTGTELWSVPTGFLYAVVIDPSGTKALIAFGADGGGDPYRIQRLDLGTGRAEDVLVQERGPRQYLSNELSTVAHPVLLPSTGISSSIGDAAGQTSALLLDPATGRVTGLAFTVGAP